MINDLEQFSVERLEQVAKTPEKYDHRYLDNQLTASEARALARIALAVKQSEPVAWTTQSNLDAVAMKIPNNLEFMSGDKRVYKRPVPLYSTPPFNHVGTTNEMVAPDGWKLVPEEANLSMLTLLGMTGSFEFMQQKYKNMLAAAPAPEDS